MSCFLMLHHAQILDQWQISAGVLYFLPFTFSPLHHGLERGWSRLDFGTLMLHVLSFPQQTINATDFNMLLLWLSMIKNVTINEIYHGITICMY